MICIGVLSEQKKKVNEIKLISICEKNIANIKLYVAEICCWDCRFKNISRLFNKIIRTIAKFCLKRRGVQLITNGCEDKCGSTMTIPLTDSYLTKCAFEVAENNIDINNVFYLKDSDLKYVDYRLLSHICNKTKFACILTENFNSADALCDEIFDRFGVYPEICDINYKIPYKAKTVIDFDNKTVKFNHDTIVDGVMLELENCEIDINLPLLMKNYPEIINLLCFKSWMSGKNQLTRGLC